MKPIIITAADIPGSVTVAELCDALRAIHQCAPDTVVQIAATEMGDLSTTIAEVREQPDIIQAYETCREGTLDMTATETDADSRLVVAVGRKIRFRQKMAAGLGLGLAIGAMGLGIALASRD